MFERSSTSSGESRDNTANEDTEFVTRCLNMNRWGWTFDRHQSSLQTVDVETLTSLEQRLHRFERISSLLWQLSQERVLDDDIKDLFSLIRGVQNALDSMWAIVVCVKG